MPVYTPGWSNLSEIAGEEMQDRVDSAWLNSGKGALNKASYGEAPTPDHVFIIVFIVLFAINCTNQIKSNYLNSHGEEAQEKPPGL